MKISRALFIAFLIGYGATEARTLRGLRGGTSPIKQRLKDLDIKVSNATGANIAKVSATFRFYGENTLGEPYVDGKVVIDDLKEKSSILLKSDDALYHGKNTIKEYFGKKGPEYVVLHKLCIGRWHLKWIGNILSSELKFKDGTQQRDFVITVEKNRFGLPRYVVKPKSLLTKSVDRK